MSVIGYEFLREAHELPAFPVSAPARPGGYTHVHRLPDGSLAVPRAVAPSSNDVLEHILFALRYEGTNLQVLSHALLRVPARAMAEAVAATPNGAFVRKAAFLWEYFNAQQLSVATPVGGGYTDLFDPSEYFVGPAQRTARWRVNFNGLGSLDYCVSVRRTPAIEELSGKRPLERARSFAQEIGPAMLDRALAWAYLSETESSFAIEREAPSEDKARTFVRLLKQAHERRPLSEDYLVDLHGAVISNPLERAFSFRREQNWLRGPIRGAAGVTYVPPPPEIVPELMDRLMRFANAPPADLDPVITAAVVSFGFVLVHPFMDGNGRLSRFLAHHALCRSGQLPQGFLLPVSMAMKRHEDEYLGALKAFSQPARELWHVQWLDAAEYATTLAPGAETIYRYWDATAAAEFMLRMTEISLDEDLRRETHFLASYDRVVKAVNERYDVRGSDLAELVVMCFDNEGVVSKRRRKQFQRRMPDAVFDFIEARVKEEISDWQHASHEDNDAESAQDRQLTPKG